MTVQHLNLPNVAGKYRFGVSLSKMCWFGVGGSADVLFIPKDVSDLQHFLMNRPLGIPVTILGVGSNILVRDGGIRGIVIRLGSGFNYMTHNPNSVTAGAATLDMSVAMYCISYGLGGMEFLAGIPGTIGGAITMNAGAYGYDIASILISAEAIDMDGTYHLFSVQDLQYQYRMYSMLGEYIFTSATMRYVSDDRNIIKSKIQAIQHRRITTQPIKCKTGGSTFKNPPMCKAWQLIDAAGCRGLKIGGAMVSVQHCNFVMNIGNATAADLENLIITIQKRVADHSGILLEPEVKILGEYQA